MSLSSAKLCICFVCSFLLAKKNNNKEKKTKPRTYKAPFVEIEDVCVILCLILI